MRARAALAQTGLPHGGSPRSILCPRAPAAASLGGLPPAAFAPVSRLSASGPAARSPRAPAPIARPPAIFPVPRSYPPSVFPQRAPPAPLAAGGRPGLSGAAGGSVRLMRKSSMVDVIPFSVARAPVLRPPREGSVAGGEGRLGPRVFEILVSGPSVRWHPWPMRLWSKSTPMDASRVLLRPEILGALAFLRSFDSGGRPSAGSRARCPSRPRPSAAPARPGRSPLVHAPPSPARACSRGGLALEILERLESGSVSVLPREEWARLVCEPSFPLRALPSEWRLGSAVAGQGRGGGASRRGAAGSVAQGGLPAHGGVARGRWR